MELWIRSQNRETLLKVEKIQVTAYVDDKYLRTIIVANDVEVAEYKTKERALEVLDEIQEFIENRGKVKITQDINGITSETEEPNKVYEMPKE